MGSSTLDSIFLLFAALNIIDIAIELFIESHVLQDKLYTIFGIILGEKKTPFKEIVTATMFGIFLGLLITTAATNSFGIRVCSSGSYEDGGNCVECSKYFGDDCLECNIGGCTECKSGYYYD
jgi:hypothetical protein